ncbi:hypothetical protein [Roseateles sp. P5_E1]
MTSLFGQKRSLDLPKTPMNWKPISEASLWDLINAGEARMNIQQARLWEAIRIQPAKWSEPTYGREGGGFWAVAVIGGMVVWFNDIEDGFNRSRYTSFGKIDEYLCNQDELEMAIQQVCNMLETGVDSASRCGPPKAGEYLPGA